MAEGLPPLSAQQPAGVERTTSWGRPAAPLPDVPTAGVGSAPAERPDRASLPYVGDSDADDRGSTSVEAGGAVGPLVTPESLLQTVSPPRQRAEPAAADAPPEVLASGEAGGPVISDAVPAAIAPEVSVAASAEPTGPVPAPTAHTPAAAAPEVAAAEPDEGSSLQRVVAEEAPVAHTIPAIPEVSAAPQAVEAAPPALAAAPTVSAAEPAQGSGLRRTAAEAVSTVAERPSVPRGGVTSPNPAPRVAAHDGAMSAAQLADLRAAEIREARFAEEAAAAARLHAAKKAAELAEREREAKKESSRRVETMRKKQAPPKAEKVDLPAARKYPAPPKVPPPAGFPPPPEDLREVVDTRPDPMVAAPARVTSWNASYGGKPRVDERDAVLDGKGDERWLAEQAARAACDQMTVEPFVPPQVTLPPAPPRPAQIPSATAANLYRAMKGWGTDEDAIYTNLATVNSEENWRDVLDAFRRAHTDFHDGDLIRALKDELSRRDLEKCHSILKQNGVDMYGGGRGAHERPQGDAAAQPATAAPATSAPAIEGDAPAPAATAPATSTPALNAPTAPAPAQLSHEDDTAAGVGPHNTIAGRRRTADQTRHDSESARADAAATPQAAGATAANLYRAMKGFGTDEDAIYENLALVTSTGEWREVLEAFKQAHADFYKGDLLRALKDELSRKELEKCKGILEGNGVDVYGKDAQAAPPAVGDPAEIADSLGKAIAGFSADEEAIFKCLSMVGNMPAWRQVLAAFQKAHETIQHGDLIRALKEALSEDELAQAKAILAARGVDMYGKAELPAESDDAPTPSCIADGLYKAMKALGVDEEAIYSGLGLVKSYELWGGVLASFRVSYPRCHGGDLIRALKTELSAKELAKCKAVLRGHGVDMYGKDAPEGVLSAAAADQETRRQQQQQQPPPRSPQVPPPALAEALFQALHGFSADEEEVYAQLRRVASVEAWQAVRDEFARLHVDFRRGDLVGALVDQLSTEELAECRAILLCNGVHLDTRRKDVAFQNGGDRPGTADSAWAQPRVAAPRPHSWMITSPVGDGRPDTAGGASSLGSTWDRNTRSPAPLDFASFVPLPTGGDEGSKARRRQLFDVLDVSGSGRLSLAELSRGIRDVLRIDHVFSECRFGVMAAFRAGAKDSHGVITRRNFRAALKVLEGYIDAWELYCSLVGVSSESPRACPEQVSPPLHVDDFCAAAAVLRAKGVAVDYPESEFLAFTGGREEVHFPDFAEWLIARRQPRAHPQRPHTPEVLDIDAADPQLHPHPPPPEAAAPQDWNAEPPPPAMRTRTVPQAHHQPPGHAWPGVAGTIAHASVPITVGANPRLPSRRGRGGSPLNRPGSAPQARPRSRSKSPLRPSSPAPQTQVTMHGINTGAGGGDWSVRFYEGEDVLGEYGDIHAVHTLMESDFDGAPEGNYLFLRTLLTEALFPVRSATHLSRSGHVKKMIAKGYADALAGDSAIQRRFLTSYETVLRCMGCRADLATGAVTNESNRFAALAARRHGHFTRFVTRLLHSLDTFGFPHFQAQLVDMLVDEMALCPAMEACRDVCVSQWIPAVEEPRDQVALAQKVNLLGGPSSGSGAAAVKRRQRDLIHKRRSRSPNVRRVPSTGPRPQSAQQRPPVRSKSPVRLGATFPLRAKHGLAPQRRARSPGAMRPPSPHGAHLPIRLEEDDACYRLVVLGTPDCVRATINVMNVQVRVLPPLHDGHDEDAHGRVLIDDLQDFFEYSGRTVQLARPIYPNTAAKNAWGTRHTVFTFTKIADGAAEI